jgi:uncharacterized membrane protein YccF (DUF307 family)
MENIKQKIHLFIWKTQVPPLRTVSRFLWIFLSGWSLFLLYAGAAVALIPTVIGLVFFPKMLQIALLALDPVDKELVHGAGYTTMPEKILNGLWLILFGWEIFLFHIFLAIIQALTIYGIGNAVRHYEIATATLLPYGKEVVPRPMPHRPSA